VDDRGDRADCGPGDDFVFDARVDLLLPACEALELPGLPPPSRVATYAQPRYTTQNKVVFAVPCVKPLRDPRTNRCRGRLVLSTAAGRRERTFAIPKEQQAVGVRKPPGATSGTEARARVRYRTPAGSEFTAADYLILLP
jgi:hypothetical protein